MDLNWGIIASIILLVILLLVGGSFKKFVNSVRQLMNSVADAIEDDSIDDRELAAILKDAKAVGKVLFEIARLFTRR